VIEALGRTDFPHPAVSAKQRGEICGGANVAAFVLAVHGDVESISDDVPLNPMDFSQLDVYELVRTLA
jgi:hypothetical protein